ncbi:MAG: hypothetical protein KAY37_03735 [Phycisphaerae bacterium]|nr:hypothetical protein [Phycisphaerae bacterium]
MDESSISVDSFLLCEDVRQETNGQHTLVGVFSDVLHVPVLPLVFPRLAVFVRIRGLKPGKRAYALKVSDETQGVEVVAAKGEHDQYAGVESSMSAFTFRFGAVQARSWGVFTMRFTLGDDVAFSRSIRLRPPSWDMIYVPCTHCKSIVSAGVSAVAGASVALAKNEVRCSHCHKMTDFDDRTAIHLTPPSYTLGPPDSDA